MKSYPSIPNASLGAVRPFDAHVFDKLDGQNVRVEYSISQGWYKFGSRTQLVDEHSEAFAPMIAHFRSELDEPLTRVARSLGARKMMVFAEWWGSGSLGGRHVPGAELSLSVIDATVDQRGWMSPEVFRSTFESVVPTPEYLGLMRWDRDLVGRVRQGLVPCTNEGVVGKSLQGPVLVMAKAKTQVWLDQVRAAYADAEKIINS